MFKRKTTFILGAGASWHYGYPTGEELVQKAVETARDICRAYYAETDEAGKTPSPFVETYPQHYRSQEQFDSFIRHLRLFEAKVNEANPLVIDDFLGHNKDIADVGKLLIAMVLLECESDASSRPAKKREREERALCGDWIRYVVQQLTVDCDKPSDLLDNEVYFVTFNYDLSLETGLYWKLANYNWFNNGGFCDDFLSQGRIQHVYGQLYGFDVKHPSTPTGTYNNARFPLADKIDRAYDAAQNIRTISPDEKSASAEILTVIKEAEYLYFLGYGFDRRNNRLLQLNSGIGVSGAQHIFFTNYGNKNKVSKTVESIYVPQQNAHDLNGLPLGSLLGENYQKRSMPHLRGTKFDVEKSTKSVYDALADDFDWPE